MTWTRRLKRVCGGAMRIIACIEDPDVIDMILTHLDAKMVEPNAPSSRRAGRYRKRARSTD